MKTWKKRITALVTGASIFIALSQTAFGQTLDIKDFNINDGNITCNESDVLYHITGTNNENHITVSGGTPQAPIQVDLDDVSIDLHRDDEEDCIAASPLTIKSGSYAIIYIGKDNANADNFLYGGNVTGVGTNPGYAGISIEEGGTVIIAGQGTLTVHGGGTENGAAGIGGNNGVSGSNITIQSGTISATGAPGAAGIGGGKGGAGGTITIKGGTVTATGGTGGRAIGAGSANDGGTVSITPSAAMLLSFSDVPITDRSSVTSSVLVAAKATHDYKADTHYNKISARISTAYAVSGTVKDSTGAPVDGAAVSSSGQSTTTDATGAYTLNLDNGSHVITAEKGDLRGTKDNVTVNSGVLIGQDITLKAMDVPPAPPAPEPEHTGDYMPSQVTVYNDPVQHNATIWLTGSGLNSSDLLMTERYPRGNAHEALLKLAGDSDVFATYNIYLRSGEKRTGYAMDITFDLNARYAGQDFTLVHQKADSSYEYFYDTADASGDLTFGPLYELSPFMLVKGTLTAGAVDIPQTGDNTQPALWIGTALLMMCALLAGAAFCKRKGTNNRRMTLHLN